MKSNINEWHHAMDNGLKQDAENIVKKLFDMYNEGYKLPYFSYNVQSLKRSMGVDTMSEVTSTAFNTYTGALCVNKYELSNAVSNGQEGFQRLASLIYHELGHAVNYYNAMKNSGNYEKEAGMDIKTPIFGNADKKTYEWLRHSLYRFQKRELKARCFEATEFLNTAVKPVTLQELYNNRCTDITLMRQFVDYLSNIQNSSSDSYIIDDLYIEITSKSSFDIKNIDWNKKYKRVVSFFKSRLDDFTKRINKIYTDYKLGYTKDESYNHINSIPSKMIDENVERLLDECISEGIVEGTPKSRIIKEEADLSSVGELDYSCDFDEDEYKEWLEDNEYPSSTDATLKEYYEDYVTYDIELLDNETFHVFDHESLYYSEIEDEYGEKIANTILRDCMEDGEGKIETATLYDEEEIDINNPEELNDRAKKLLQHGNYYKDCRGYILTDGTVIYTPNEHNQVTVIDGVKNTFHFIKLGNIRVLPQSIDLSKRPTQQQRNVLRQIISSYEDETLYVDILPDNGQEIGVTYRFPDWRRVLNEIDRYFREGIKPMGN